MAKNILALDASTKRTGYAIQQDGVLVSYGAIASTSQKLEKRLVVMRDGVKKLVEDYKIDTVVIEDVRPDNVNLHTHKILTWLQGILAVAAYEGNPAVNFLLIGASTWRSILKLQGYAVKRESQKTKDIAYANDKYTNIHLNPDQDDEADAICILDAFVKNNYSVENSKTTKSKQEFAF